MTKPLADMTIEELWRLFPIILKEHNPDYYEWYREEEEQVVQALVKPSSESTTWGVRRFRA
ncbi:hypothetical protein [Gorillibacterium sp. CAU 1737]|uniref:hypothetical protein n=1 Tax=Gorillibacterium sp. CAU 1737 TaxID=3140362 RepID=UPI00325FE0D5